MYEDFYKIFDLTCLLINIKVTYIAAALMFLKQYFHEGDSFLTCIISSITGLHSLGCIITKRWRNESSCFYVSNDGEIRRREAKNIRVTTNVFKFRKLLHTQKLNICSLQININICLYSQIFITAFTFQLTHILVNDFLSIVH